MSYDVTMTRPEPFGLLNLRADSAIADLFSTNLGVELPHQPNTVSSNHDTTVLWLGPDEWLVRTADQQEYILANSLQNSAAGKHAAVTVVSDYYITFRLNGSQCNDVLCQATGIDLRTQSFRAGECARTAFAKATVLLHKISNDDCYDIYVPRSYARYVQLFLTRASGNQNC